MDSWPIGVFASVDAGLGVAWDVISELQVPTIQLHAPHGDKRNQSAAESFRKQLDGMGVRCTAVFGGFEGESYADIPTVVRTVGLVPEATRQDRLREMFEISEFANWLGCDTVALHLGFIPHDPGTHPYPAIVDVTRQLCDHCSKHGQFLHLETGQETAEGLLEFIKQVDRPNLKINFDPANMILYGTGEPIEAFDRWASMCAACTARTALGAINRERPGVLKCPLDKVMLEWSVTCGPCKKSGTPGR